LAIGFAFYSLKAQQAAIERRDDERRDQSATAEANHVWLELGTRYRSGTGELAAAAWLVHNNSTEPIYDLDLAIYVSGGMRKSVHAPVLYPTGGSPRIFPAAGDWTYFTSGEAIRGDRAKGAVELAVQDLQVEVSKTSALEVLSADIRFGDRDGHRWCRALDSPAVRCNPV